jgi:hypothetical protein
MLTSVESISRPGLHCGSVPGTVMSENGHGLPGQLALLAGGQSSWGRSSRESIAWAARPIGTGQVGKAAVSYLMTGQC